MSPFRLMAALLLLAGGKPVPEQYRGFAVEGGRIVDANGRRFVFRGVNLAHAWLPERSARDLPAIAETGANSVRIALGTGCLHRRTPASEVRTLVTRAKALRLVTILEVHDATGYGEDKRACPVDNATDYWRSIRDVLTGEEAYVILDIANEPRGNVEPERWVQEHRRAIAAMRAAGFTHLVMIDGPNWGQDRLGVMRDAAPALAAADPLRRLAFDVHMYGDYPDEATVERYLDSFAKRRLALVVGEFGDEFRGTDIPADFVMTASAERASGYLAWSWSPNGKPDANLDLVVGGDLTRRTAWGRKVFASFGKARPASVFPAR